MSTNEVSVGLVALLAIVAPACGGSAPSYAPPKLTDGGVCSGGACDAVVDVPNDVPNDADASAPTCVPATKSDASVPARCLVVIASGRNDLVGFAIDGASVFWTERSGSGFAVKRAPALGGPVSTVVTSDRRAVAIGAGNVFLNSGNGLVATAVADVSATAPVQGFGRNFAASASDVYVATCDGTFGSVLDLPTSGAAPSMIDAVGCMNDLAFADGTLYGASIGGDKGAITVPAGVWAWSLDGTPGTSLVGRPARDAGASYTLFAPLGVVADATNVYWTEHGHGTAIPSDGAVMKMPLAGGTPEALVSGLHGPGDMALDGDTLYWGNTDGRIMKVSVTGGPATVLATDQIDPLNVTVDADAVYWTNRGAVGAPEAAVLRLAPK
ncbi:MAG TPA: hypothetical protein VHJ20_19615 [Polyangia bacterium]|nr:hypothetical protein [Polyangia bacterium]